MPDPRSRIELAIDQAMRQDRMSRRSFLGRAGRGGVALGAMMTLPGLIAACSPSSGGEGTTIEWANWPAYIDIDEEIDPSPTQYPTINAFIEQTGYNVNYVEAIQDNEDFFGQIQPDLSAGNPTGWDIISPSDWMVDRLIKLDYLEPLDLSLIPNLEANAADYARGLYYDPDNEHSVWWQGGITGIGYNPTLTGREITSFSDLLDPEFAGSVGLFKEMRDTFGLQLLDMGVVPTEATLSDVEAAQAVLLEAAEAGQFRGFYGNEYYDELAAGNLAVTVAWSGDVTQMQLYDNPDIQFVIPSGGAMRWNDNLIIPKGAAHIAEAHALINYWYDPVPATMLSEYIGYFTPVAEVPDRIQADADAARESGDTETADLLDVVAATVSPTEDQLNNTYEYKRLEEEEEAAWADLWLELRGA
ncbi:MAG TPA: extracellular solute-binding protein [Candidatus Limnocylindria bacterium]|jgi:spermidine/putrescine transport system substrate-binding protein